MRHVLSLIFLMLLAVSVRTQTPDNRSAEEVVRDYNAASLKQEWTGMAALVHPDSLKEFRSLFVVIVDKDLATSKKIFGIKSKADFELLSNAQILERLLGFMKGDAPELAGALSSMKVDVIGSVEEAPELRHFVYRVTFDLGPARISKVDLYSVKRFENSWRILMSDDEIRAMANALLQPDPQLLRKVSPSKRKKSK